MRRSLARGLALDRDAQLAALDEVLALADESASREA
jgi:hypothetical protein